MQTKSYTLKIEFDKSPEIGFNSICNITKWWSLDFEGNSSRLNDEFTIHHPNQHYSKQKLISFIPYSEIAWLVRESKLYWLKGDQEDWTNTKMIFEISTAHDKTVLQFTHHGLVPAKESFNMCEQGWNIVAGKWLHDYIETGKPSPEMEKAAALRNKLLEGK